MQLVFAPPTSADRTQGLMTSLHAQLTGSLQLGETPDRGGHAENICLYVCSLSLLLLEASFGMGGRRIPVAVGVAE